MKPLSKHMEQLIGIAEAMLRRPRSLDLNEGTTLAAIRHADDMPAEGIRRTHVALAMVAAIEGLQQTGCQAPAATPWQMLIGAALPLLKDEAYRQLVGEMEMARG